jgi:tRNA isopentenyl-2-thiomethyl-A-37 hydroxylase MiaE
MFPLECSSILYIIIYLSENSWIITILLFIRNSLSHFFQVEKFNIVSVRGILLCFYEIPQIEEAFYFTKREKGLLLSVRLYIIKM